jgi:hypothetical protein
MADACPPFLQEASQDHDKVRKKPVITPEVEKEIIRQVSVTL